eukprot:1274786-Lingulodinium_polyedra.AAC.1
MGWEGQPPHRQDLSQPLVLKGIENLLEEPGDQLKQGELAWCDLLGGGQLGKLGPADAPKAPFGCIAQDALGLSSLVEHNASQTLRHQLPSWAHNL